MSALLAPSHLPLAEASHHISSTFSDSSTTKCGNLLAQHDSYIKTLDTVLLGVVQVKPEQASKREKKKKKAESKEERGICYLVTCKDSVIFPMGGGQPADFGTLIVPSLEVNFAVCNASNVRGICVLSCHTKDEIPDLSALLNLPCTMNVDWERRLDHMQQHTAQHVISALALDKFNLDTHSWNLYGSTEPCTVDFKLGECKNDSFGDLDSVLSSYPFSNVEQSVNDHIFHNRKVAPSWLDVSSDEYKNTVRSRLLPKGFSGDIRVVDINQIDKSTCCGTHVSSLSHLTAVKVLKIVKVGKNTARISFVSGRRTMDFIANSLLHQTSIASVVSTPHLEDQVVRVQNLAAEKTKNEKTISSLWDQLIGLKATALATSAVENSVAVDDLGPNVVDKDVYKKLATAIISKAPNSTVFLLSGGGEPGITFYLQGSAVDAVGKQVASLLGGRGGGKGGIMQGKIPPLDEIGDTSVRAKLGEVEELLKSAN